MSTADFAKAAGLDGRTKAALDKSGAKRAWKDIENVRKEVAEGQSVRRLRAWKTRAWKAVIGVHSLQRPKVLASFGHQVRFREKGDARITWFAEIKIIASQFSAGSEILICIMAFSYCVIF